MSAIPWENEGDRNYICMRHIVTNIVKEGLRKVFKQEWDTRYQAKFGAWDDTNASGQQLFHLEKTRSRPNKNLYQSKFQHGDTNQWDCSVLFDAILYSHSIGKASLNPTIETEVDNLRNIRNKIMHADKAKLSDVEFQTYTKNVENAFTALGLSINDITLIKTERNRYKSFQALPSKPTHEVVYRSEKINEIKNDLQKLHADNDGKLTYYYISGIPGSGKSQLAGQLCEELYNSTDWQTETTFVMTLNAKDLNSLLYSHEDFCRRLNCDEDAMKITMNSAKPDEEKIKNLRSLMTTRIKNWRRWWIIVDNVENLQIIAPLLPRRSDAVWNNGQIILTIQNTTSVPSDSSFTKHISLSRGMNDQECRQLLSTLSGSDANDQILDEVSERLDKQPLAIAAAAVYFRKVREANCFPQFSWQDYLEKLEGKRQLTEQQLLKTNPEYSSTMSAAVLLAVEKSAAENFILDHTLHLFSLLSFEPLPREIIVKYIELLDHMCDKEEIYLSINSCSLFLTENEGCDVRLHRVVHEATKLYNNSPEQTEIKDSSQTRPANKVLNYDVPSRVHNAVKMLHFFKVRDDKIKLIPHLKSFITAIKKLFPDEDSLYLISLSFENNEIFQIYSFFGNILRFYCEFKLALKFQNLNLQIWGESKKDIKIAIVYDELGGLHWELGEQSKAKEYHEKALEIKKKQLGSNHLLTAVSYNNLGLVYHDKGDLDKAKGNHHRALEIRKKQLGSNHVDVATSYNNLGEVYRVEGDLDQAKDYLHQALQIQVKQLGSNHVDVAVVYNNFGAVYKAKGDLDRAADYFHRALEICVKQLGSNHVNVARSYHNIGEVYKAKGDLNQAEDYHHRALEILVEQLGSHHANVATSYNNIGLVYRAKGELDQAQDYFHRSLEILVKQSDSNHLDVATSYDNLGLVCQDKGDLDQAKDYHHRALEIWVEQLGSNHVKVATSYNNLGTLYRAKGDLDEAKDYHHRALDIWVKQLGLNHVDVATSYSNLGLVCQDKGDLDQAKDYLHRALEIFVKQLGSNHVNVATSCSNLGLVCEAKGDLDQAKDYHHRALEIWVEQLGSNHVKVATSYNNLGTVYQAKGDWDQAKDYFHRAQEILVKQLGSNHVKVATSYNNLGTVYQAKGDLDQAKDYFHRALEIWVKQLGSNHVNVATSFSNLGLVCKDKDELDLATDYLRRALEIYVKQLGSNHVKVATCYNNLSELYRVKGDHY